MKANSGWVDISLSLLFGMFSQPTKVGISPSLLFFSNDKSLYGQADKVAAGTNAERALTISEDHRPIPRKRIRSKKNGKKGGEKKI